VTNELEQVDAMCMAGQAVRSAKKKNIDENDLKRLKVLCDEMAATKSQKARLKMKWIKYLRPIMGRDVFDWRKSEIIDMFARYQTVEEVKANLEKKGYSTAIDHIWKFFLNNRDIIDKKRAEFLRSAKDHFLATDAGRMETLAMLHQRFVGIFNDTYSTSNPNKTELRLLSQEIRAIIEQARKEIKGEEVKLTIDGKIDINASIQAAATIQDISKKLPINIIPIYLVATKQGIDPHLILSSLTNSFYKNFNGFRKLKNSGPAPTTLDIIRNYDWNEISKYHSDKPEDQTQETDYEEISFVEMEKVKTKREKLLELINQQMTDKS
jgi:hypothetical protein